MLRVLLVEDEPHAREFITTVLNDGGHAVHAVQNAEVALVILEEGVRFDLLITDIMLPWGIDGIQLAERATRLQSGLRCLYVTGLAGFTRRELGALHGPLLTKPMRVTKLRAAVEEAMSGGRGVIAGFVPADEWREPATACLPAG
jgi:CheY-like chemotaxis protein